MRSHVPLLCCLFAIALTVLVSSLASDGLAESRDDSLTLLKLQERIAALEARIERMESQLSGVQQAAGVAPPVVTVPRTLEDTTARRIPNNWKRGEINGVPFYTLPLGRQTADE